MITINITKDQADELYFATSLLYQEYDDERGLDYNNYIRKYNNSVDELRQILKEAINNG